MIAMFLNLTLMGKQPLLSRQKRLGSGLSKPLSPEVRGQKIVAGLGLGCRPCEPVDVLAVVERLYRGRRLLMDHILVLRFYGRRQMSPDPQRAKEMRAHSLWQEAMERIEDVLIAKGIVKKPHWTIEKEREYYESKQSISLGEDALGRIFG
jgi:hypothetical protein